MSLPSSFGALIRYNQFINWQPVRRGDGKVDKVPWDPVKGVAIDPHNPANHLKYQQARERSKHVGFVFTDHDPFFFLDIDHCYDSAAGTWNAISRAVIPAFQGACFEWSVSQTGVHVFGTYDQPFPHRKKNTENKIELYTSGRFVALTGLELYNGQGDAGFNASAPLQALVNAYFNANGSGGDPDVPLEWTKSPVKPGFGVTDRDQALRVLLSMKSGRSMFGGANRASPADLFFGNAEALGRAYPPQNNHDPFDRSAADMALASHLSFITGGNCEMIQELMKASALNRDKWHDRPAWLRETITNAVSHCQNFYSPKPINDKTVLLPGAAPVTLPQTDTAAPGISTPSTPPTSQPGVSIMPVTQQIEYFSGCVYIGDQNRVYLPNGRIWKPEQFKNHFGGHKFIIDPDGKTTKNAFDAFIDNQAHKFPRVVSALFRPDRPPGEITVDEHGVKSVNVFTPQFGKRVAGDASPMLDHIAQLLPYDHDQQILLDYLAGCVQYPGVKFQWCPVVQGVEGNGKSRIYKALEYALGKLYCHQVDPRDLEGKFNGWLEFKLLIAIEEIRTNARREVADILKPWITNDRVPLQAKGQDQRTIDNVANFLLFSNHKDAVLKTRTDRRYAVFYTAQQDADDKKLCGMTNAYFRNLISWLENGGYAIFTDYLARREIKTDLQGEAPETTSTAEALIESQGVAEHMLLEAIESEQPGFKGGLVCVQDATDYLNRNGKKLSTKKTASVLKNLGFDIHPAIKRDYPSGRIFVAGIKRRIMIRKGALLENLESADSVRDKWQELKTLAVHELSKGLVKP